ncbi:MAG TPA: PQQ-binding-like beta-propeller repeat protein [Terriglobia bacterium]|nr:PQQ-binding-like beta-propeller repeat protein [Terriglobia bacterium]
MAGLVFIGINGRVLALDKSTGKEVWRTDLPGLDFVNVVVEDGNVFASSRGEILCLRPEDGGIRWHNKLERLGCGFVTIAGGGQNTVASAGAVGAA